MNENDDSSQTAFFEDDLSTPFKRKIQFDTSDPTTPTLCIFHESPNEIFEEILKYMYTGKIVLTPNRACSLLSLALFLEMPLLKNNITTYLSHVIEKKNALDFLRPAICFGLQDVIQICQKIIAKNFKYFCSSGTTFHSFPKSVLYGIFHHPDLAAKSEYKV